MARKQNKTDWPDNVLPAADIKVMVMQLFDSARRLKDCGDLEGAADAAYVSSLYSADASMDGRFRKALRKLRAELPERTRSKFKLDERGEREGKGLKNRLLRA